MEIQKLNFFNEYFKNKYIDNETKKTLTKVLNLKNSNKKFFTHNKSEDVIFTDILYNIEIQYEIFDVNFRDLLKDHIKKNYEKRAYFFFYVLKIDLDPIDKPLPLSYMRNDYYNLDIILNTKLKIFKIGDVLKMYLKLNNDNNSDNNEDNFDNIYAVNEFIYCKIVLDYHHNYILETDINRKEMVLKKDNKVFCQNDEVQIILLDFFSNRCLNNFSNKLNCLGKLKL